MAVKTYLLSFEHEYIDAGKTWNKSATESALTSAGATIDTDFDHSFLGYHTFFSPPSFSVIPLSEKS